MACTVPNDVMYKLCAIASIYKRRQPLIKSFAFGAPEGAGDQRAPPHTAARRFRGFRGFWEVRPELRGRAGAWCGLTAGEHARGFWLIRASRPIHQSCPRTTVCADVMLVGSRSRVGIPAPAWSKQLRDRLSGVAPYRYPPATSSQVSWASLMERANPPCTGRRRSLFVSLIRGPWAPCPWDRRLVV
jgi:hypothetical protein